MMKIFTYPLALLNTSILALNEITTAFNETISSYAGYTKIVIQRRFNWYDKGIGLIPMNGKVKGFIAIVTVLINGLCALLNYLVIVEADKAYKACMAVQETGCTGVSNWVIFLFLLSSFIGLFIGVGAIYSSTRKPKVPEQDM